MAGIESLRGLVILKWEESGRASWNLAQTVQETERADDALASRGLTPAPTFRRKRGDPEYVERWTLGCRFPWLNPRQGQDAPQSVRRPEVTAGESERQLALTVTNDQREGARKILEYVANEIERIAGGDPDLSFRLRRYVHARIQLKNRPPEKLRGRLFDKQEGICEFCRKPITQLKGTDMHRVGSARYTEENTVLVHRTCHQDHHLRKGETPEED